MQEEQPSRSDDPYVAVAVMVPEDHFSDEDGICLQAASHVCSRLEHRLLEAGHTVEDWGVYYESAFQDQKFQYMIMFFPDERGAEQRLIAVQFEPKSKRIGFLKALFGKPPPFEAAPSLASLMEVVGGDFEEHRMLTKTQFDHEYMGA
jgi:hypothetical protein